MEQNTEAIIRLAWARSLGLEDDALTGPASERVTRVDDRVVMFVSLWRHRVLIGPHWLLDRAAAVADRDLVDGAGIVALTRDHVGRLVGEAVLGYTDGYVEHDGIEAAVVSDDPEMTANLERLCPPDDVAEVGLSGLAHRFVLVDELDQTLAGAGYDEREGLLAQLGVLTPPHLRRTGQALLAGAIATNDALDSGLVPQWRSRREHRASLGLARRLGYQLVGSQTTVLLRVDSSA